MLQKFIERPVLSTVISTLLVILGAISAFTLPISQFPDIAPPTVVVTASYPGANAEAVARSVATPIEEAVNGVENMTYMTSNSSNDGSMTLTVFFEQGTDPDIAAVNVQNRVSKASNKIPQEVIQAGISTQKQQNSFLMFLALTSKDTLYDEAFIQNYLKINVIPQMQRIPGVAEVQPFGGREYAMRIWLQPDRLMAYNLSPQEVMQAVTDQNVESAPGRLGQSSPEMFEYVVKYKGKFSQHEDYENIIVKATNDGQLVRLKDVARVSFGSFSYAANSRLNGGATSGIALLQTAGSNANEILIEAKRQIDALEKRLPKGIEPVIMFNAKDFLDESISQVNHTLVEAFILVFLVVFIFLQDFRSTLIPAIAVPVAVVGTFFFMQLFGFSINLLTLFALVLAIGIVVDDAIVVVEAVHSKMERTGLTAQDATRESMKEISGAIVSITLVMVAVFVPVTFMQGPAGVFYKQFAFTLAIAIGISALNALTLSPALCALFLKDPHTEGHAAGKGGFLNRFFRAFNVGFTAITDKYVRALQLLLRRKWVVVSGLALVTVVTAVMIQRTPTGFIPTEDQGFVLYAVNTPPGSSLARTERAMKQIEEIVANEPFTLNHYQVDGLNFISNANAAPYGAGFIRTKPKDERGPVKDYEAIAATLTQKVAAEVKGAQAVFFTFPTVSGFGNVDGFEFMLQDRGNGSLEKLDATAKAFIAALFEREEIAFAFTTFAANNPQYELIVDDEKAKQLGVDVSDLLQTMQIYFGSTFVSDFNRFGKFYRVIAQADIPYRASASSLNEIYVKNRDGDMVAANALVTLKRVYGAETVTRNNLYNAVTINGKPNVGYSTGDAITAIEETAAEVLPRDFAYEWTGMTREEKNAGSQLIVIFIMSLVFVFFLLAAQYESYILPLAVVTTIPLGIFGVMLFINLMGIENNIYVQVAMIMLIGLLAKNAILIVEYAVQRRRSGMGLLEAALEAARLRLRPILMTSFAFIVGMIPLLRASGGSALGNHSIGAGAVGGMLTGVVLGIFVIPVLFVIFQYLHERVSAKRKPHPALQPAALLLAVVSLAYSCSSGREAVRPDGVVPDTYRTEVGAADRDSPAADSVGIARMPWKQFFTDTALQAVIDSVLARNYDMQVALNNITLSETYLKQARVAWLPTVQAEVSANTSRPSENSLNGMNLNNFIGSSHIEDYTAAAGVSWEVDVWGRIRQQKQASLAAYLQSTEAVKSLQTRLIAETAASYYALLTLHEQLRIARSNLALSDSTLRAIQLQHTAGQATLLAVQQAEVQREQTKAWIPRLEQAMLIQENALSILMAHEPQPVKTGSRLQDFVVPEQFATGIPAAMVSRRPDVKASEYAVDEASAQVGVARANRYPALRITAAGGVNAFQASNWFVMPASLFGNLAGNVMQPVFNGRRLKTQYEASKIQRENAVIRFRQTVLNAVGEVSDALAQLDKLEEEIEISRSQRDRLEKAIPNAQLLFASGMASYLEVITAQQHALQTELEFADLKRQQINAYVQLYRSLGGGVE